MKWMYYIYLYCMDLFDLLLKGNDDLYGMKLFDLYWKKINNLYDLESFDLKKK